MANKPKCCIYCGKKAETREHIPAKNLFKNTTGVSFVTVPSCKKCNYGFQNDEIYFRQLLTAILYEQSPIATFLLDNQVGRSIKRRPALGAKMFKQMSLVDIYTTENIYLGKKTALHIEKGDHERVFRVLDKYIKGLFFYHFNMVIPSDWEINHHWLKRRFEEKVVSTLRELRWERIKEDTFVYGFNSVPVTHQSVWCLIYYGQPLFYSMVIDPVSLKKFEEKRKNLSGV